MVPRPHITHTTVEACTGDDEYGSAGATTKHLVLVGGGHAHVQVIKALNKTSRPRQLHVTLIDVQDAASYSGMVPGCVSKLYTHDDTRLHLRPLADWAKIDFIHGEVVDIDMERKLIYLNRKKEEESDGSSDDSEAIGFDAVSMDIGSTSRDLDKVPGAAEFAIPTRPISDLVLRIEQAEEYLVASSTDKDTNNNSHSNDDNNTTTHVVVIGGGVAGIELAMSIHGRWSSLLNNLQVTILDAACRSKLLPDETEECRKKLLDILKSKDIHIQHECGVDRLEEGCVHLHHGGTKLPFRYCIWATGAGAHPLALTLSSRGLAVDKYGWIEVNEHLQSVSHPFLFAAGDCAVHPSHPPKAGVYAVRSGPVLIQNLTSYLFQRHGTTTTTAAVLPATFNPQSDFLKLLACGDGTSLGFRFGIPIHGRWVWQIKDTIDNAFMNLFKVENLPKSEQEKLYDVSQYDVAYACRDHANPLDPKEAAILLRRDDDDVDYQQAWKVLRDMVCMLSYRKEVLEHWHAIAAIEAKE